MTDMKIPCAIGDKVWGLGKYNGTYRPKLGVVAQMYFDSEEMHLVISVRGLCRGLWGERIFSCRDDAERAAEKLNSRAKSG